MRILLALSLLLLSPGLPCYQALAMEIKTVSLTGEGPLKPVVIARPGLNAELPAALTPVQLDPSFSLQNPAVPEISVVQAEQPKATWTERLANLGARFTQIIALKGDDNQLSGFGGLFDLSPNPKLAL